VVSIELHYVLVPSILVMQVLSMVRLNEVILVSHSEQGWDEGLGDMVDGGEVIDVELSF
jgi:hypothetical protein